MTDNDYKTWIKDQLTGTGGEEMDDDEMEDMPMEDMPMEDSNGGVADASTEAATPLPMEAVPGV